ncbi:MULTISPECIES: YbjN domain-containing protein [unclassified Roseofilum]|uniref:YbjN domain-containing protein n=1 Tax=unclassified Roseofilum TaxID=2620099 RepID=UPI000E8E3CED|nr:MULTISPECIES: YbjN domain-containing protein [unclassified Roseofilum]HBQ98201.1 YbjN domain-containing protein [Cyanobacteria bacterium UBA11691]
MSNPVVENTMTQELEPATPNYINEIEGVISTMIAEGQTVQAGYDSQEGYLWKFQYGSVEVYVQLTGQTDDDSLTVWSYVLSLPAKEEAQLMRKLLEMNWLKTFEAHFAIVDNRVVVVATRTVAELSPGEIARAITLVANIADDNDEALIAEFGQ